MKKPTNEKRNKARRRILLESLMVIFILVSPFIFKMHEYVSSDPEATINFLGITIDKNGFPNINVYIWFLLGKIVPLYLLLIWFFTCKHWWYHIILIPILMYAFQIFEGVISEDNYIDTDNVLWLLPFCMIVIPFVYFIRIKLYDKHVHGIDLEAMDLELSYYKEKERQELEKIGIKVKETEAKEDDLTKKTTDKTLSGLFTQLQHSLKSLFNLFL
ncbi:hypothetical protein [Muriicola sp. Z0-33]|uniref:hypothetical protein n=1 Tax=Muriicola sp. Z0-33 TaxID=2816957 RepID=UPI0022388662|nr:hypothetical protein [Muriicola sp. Z0-33]MCW5516698.1 hypothetical protein [Muriicola sp. Z0-33]